MGGNGAGLVDIAQDDATEDRAVRVEIARQHRDADGGLQIARHSVFSGCSVSLSFSLSLSISAGVSRPVAICQRRVSFPNSSAAWKSSCMVKLTLWSRK